MAMEDATVVKRTDTPFILRAKSDGQEFPLRGEMMIGREVDCAIALNSGHISRYHAKINVSHSGIYIEDLQSTNGTSVNGRKIKGRVKLNLGDQVGFDDHFYIVGSAAVDDAAKTALNAKRAQAPEDDRTRPMPRAVPPTPIRPALVAVDAVKVASDASAQQPHGGREQFPKADDIDLERPLSSRHALAGDPDFELHLEQRFSELDALIDLDLGDSPANRRAASEEMAPASFDVSQPLPQISANDAVAEDRLPEEDYSADDRTQVLSTAQLDHFIERHRHDHDINIGSGPRLIVTTAPLRGKLFSLKGYASGTSLQLGREPGAQIYLNDLTISTDHARITKTPLEFILTATHAKNGLQVNGITETKVSLQHNDRIQIGRTELVFKTDQGADESKHIEVSDPLVNGQGRSYSLIITLVALIVLVGAIVATAG